MRYRELTEAKPGEDMRRRIYYHGTSDDEKGRSILNLGIEPGNQGEHSRGHLTPVIGRSYLTTSLRYGVIYCIGGDMLGCSDGGVKYIIGRTGSQCGWLFVISGTRLLSDVQPDEDSVGEAAMYAHVILTGKNQEFYQDDPLFQGLLRASDYALRRFYGNARVSMTPRQWEQTLDGFVAAQASGGKRFLKRMTDEDKLFLINCGAHVAYQGNLIPDQAWRFDKTKAPHLAKDGSNFFELAERVR